MVPGFKAEITLPQTRHSSFLTAYSSATVLEKDLITVHGAKVKTYTLYIFFSNFKLFLSVKKSLFLLFILISDVSAF